MMVIDVHVHCIVPERMTINSPIVVIALMKIAYSFINKEGSCFFFHESKNLFINFVLYEACLKMRKQRNVNNLCYLMLHQWQ